MRRLALLLLAGAAAAGEPVRIPMRDGAELAADVHRPDAPGRYPTILVQTPYKKERLGNMLDGLARPGGAAGRGARSDVAALLDREHYAYVVVDWRGFYGSRGAMGRVDPRTWRRGQDGYDCVEWIAKQEWSNGKVGTWGGSALGKQQFDTAAEQPPHLVCCAPLIAAMGQRYENYYEGGVPLEAHVRRLDQLGFDVSRLVRLAPHPGRRIWRLVESRSYRPEAIAVPCLMITGWWDNYPDQVIRMFEELLARGGTGARESKLLVGPWDHVSIGLERQGVLRFPGAATESGRAAKAFFDYWLRGEKENGWAEVPRVRYWQVHEEDWRAAPAWSSPERTAQTLYLHPDGSLRAARPEDGRELGYRYDPRRPPPTLGGANLPPLPHGPTDHGALDRREDLVVFSTGPLDAPIRLQGNAVLTFRFRANRTDCDFFARLCARPPDGPPHLIAEGARRAKLRRGEVRPLVPGKVHEVTVRLAVTAATFREGWELRLYLSSGNSPRYERNPHTGADRWDEGEALELDVRVACDGTAVLRLPRFK